MSPAPPWIPWLLLACACAASPTECAHARAAEDPPELVFRPSDPKDVKLPPPELRQESAEEIEPPAPLEEVRGEFTECTAAHLLCLELRRRISNIDPARATERTWAKYSSARATLARWEAQTAREQRCASEVDSELAQGIMKLYRTAVYYQDLRRRAAIRAPLTLSTASQAGRLLDRVEGIPHARQPGPILKPPNSSAAADPLAVEFARRARLLDEALRRLTAAD